jgi:hypothetical protein
LKKLCAASAVVETAHPSTLATKGNQMGFEKIVLDKVAKVLGQDRQAYFKNGTLFVCAAEPDARRVFSVLFKDYNQRVRPSRVGDDEFAYDFTA